MGELMLAYLFLGLIQGIFEWLPISSEGVVMLAAQALGLKRDLIEIALFLHLGTLGAVLVYFAGDWIRILKGQEKGLRRFLLIATLISLAVGFPLYQWLKEATTGSALLLVTGLGLLSTSFVQSREKNSRIGGERLAVLVGGLQGLAVIPGFSRSAATIFGLSWAGLEPQKILKVSYLLSAPVVLASSLFLYLKNPVLVIETWPGLVASFGVGLLSLRVLLGLAERVNFSRFTLIFGLLCLLGALIGFAI